VWPAGPAWFIWVLAVFDFLAALLYALSSSWAETLGRFLAGLQGRPARFFALLLTATAVVYIPLELTYSGLAWAAFGPFTFQTARILLYFFYFLAGAGIGAWGLDRGPLMPQGKLARRWLLWVIASIGLFLICTAVAMPVRELEQELVRYLPGPLRVRELAAAGAGRRLAAGRA
jgi:hypothetical protein